jgi:hypothetical protein
MPTFPPEIIEVVANYGPFPFGILVGVWIMKWAYAAQTEYIQRENAALRKEKLDILSLVTEKENRIDMLHDKLNEKQ